METNDGPGEGNNFFDENIGGGDEPEPNGIDLEGLFAETTENDDAYLTAEAGDQPAMCVDPKTIAERVYDKAKLPFLTTIARHGPPQVFSFTVLDQEEGAVPKAIVVTQLMSPSDDTAYARTTHHNAEIGHYDPARGEWLLYPEFVKPEEVSELQAVLSDVEAQEDPMLRNARAGVDYTPYEISANVHHPLTTHARIETAELLSRSLLGRLGPNSYDHAFNSWHIRNSQAATDGPALLSDKYTTCYLYIDQVDPELFDPVAIALADPLPPSRLMVRYDGVRVTGLDGSVVRMSSTLCLAERREGNPRWAPRLKLISPMQWMVLSEAPAFLEGLKAQQPQFSLRHCAMAHFPPDERHEKLTTLLR